MMQLVHWYRSRSLRSKLISLVSLQLICLGLGFMWMFRSVVQSDARQDAADQSRQIIDLAESVRTRVAHNWRTGIYTQEQVAGWAQAGETERVLSSLPIMAAREILSERALTSGYSFKLPHLNPRNPDNTPDEVEVKVLKRFSNSASAEDYYEFDTAMNAIRYFRPIHLTEDCMICHGDAKNSQKYWGNAEGIDGTGFPMDNLAIGASYGAYEVIQSMDRADAKVAQATLRGFGMVGVAIIVSCAVLAWLLNKSLLNPLRNASLAFSRLVAGDLKHEIVVESNDEVGQLQAGINTMTQRMRAMIQSFRSNSDELGKVSTSLGQTADSVGMAAMNTSTRSQSVSTAAEEMSQSLQSIRTSLSTVSSTVQEVAAASCQVMSNAENVAINTERSARIAQDAEALAADGGQRIKQLESAANGIGDIISVIKDIAEQTNLLALNATIEASRAGEAGKGFAVVAAEVKQLAGQTAEATREIRRRIESIQTISQQVVDAIREIATVVESVSRCTSETSHAVSEQKETITKVTRQLAAAAEITRTVASGVDETVLAAQEVSLSIHEVNAIAEKTSQEVELTKAAGSNVRRVSEHFSEQLDAFAV
ncbi:methyl-accepting chemotaxis protein [Aureliella helgolandensis]|uniref:Methyl-accepting chemotaxis protein CtpH n=1 Tax=Aureliella helgolandensis TaxID=2527968 RepID=A0A518G610_9BACT|nr:methyl-accepting chemotaxis protein [Aureliella helgolandensis]QDV24004.1 Methyl-accepting chemotaxis protein CtpH [Aureliella helgolandensis]